jgi:hypothetical protein
MLELSIVKAENGGYGVFWAGYSEDESVLLFAGDYEDASEFMLGWFEPVEAEDGEE